MQSVDSVLKQPRGGDSQQIDTRGNECMMGATPRMTVMMLKAEASKLKEVHVMERNPSESHVKIEGIDQSSRKGLLYTQQFYKYSTVQYM